MFPFRTGDLHVLYEGVLSTNATLELIANGDGDNKAIIPLQAGNVSGSYGGSEDWGWSVSARFVPSGMVYGTLRITAVCGRSLKGEEREWARELWDKERRERWEREAQQNTKRE